jgi:hypothetical protein
MVDKKPAVRYHKHMKKPTKKEISAYARYLGSIKSDKKSESSKKNGRLGGRPKIKRDTRV